MDLDETRAQRCRAVGRGGTVRRDAGYGGVGGGRLPDSVASMIARTVRRHLPHSDPAPHASATCLEVVAPAATARPMVSLVTPRHRQTYIRRRCASCARACR